MSFRQLSALFIISGIFCLVTATLTAQQSKQAFTLRGKVEKVDTSAKKLTVNHDKVEGFMDAMTMPYSVDNPDVLNKVKVGDEITATVYKGDYTLHDVKVVGKH